LPESLTHPLLGHLRWEPEFSWWSADARLPSGRVVDVVVDPGGDADGASFIAKAAELFGRVVAGEPGVRREAVRKRILELYDHWRNEDEPRLTAEELADGLDLTFIRFDTVVPVTLSYALGERNDVFGGHAVDVRVDEHLRVTAVSLAG
jgi:hypothetical protein